MVKTLFENFATFNVLVIGDVMIDSYWVGQVSRISPEAPVPVLDVEERQYRLGGAANVALNVKSLGATPILCSTIGADAHEMTFLKLMKENDLSIEGIVSLSGRKTTIKHRMIANHTQMFRIDEEDSSFLTNFEEKEFLRSIDTILSKEKIDAIIFEDYDKGVLSATTIRHIISEAQKKNIPITVDPKKRNFNEYYGVTLFKPNLKELKEGLNYEEKIDNEAEISSLMQAFSHKMDIDFIMTTLSAQGVAIYDRKNNYFKIFPAFLRKIADVSGAGDTVIATATLALLAKLPIDVVTQVANLAGGIVCEHAGVVPIKAEKLTQQLLAEKIIEEKKK